MHDCFIRHQEYVPLDNIWSSQKSSIFFAELDVIGADVDGREAVVV